ncbi:MAG: hypothetical protein GX070_08785 [Alcaligenaceae bacterium]|nr:hypothetical protein [Alcaligenaceae bacterium]
MNMFFANSGLYAIQQLGISGAVGGIFAIVYLITLLAIIIASTLLLWGLWRYIKARQGLPRKPLHPALRILVIILSLYPVLVAMMYLQIWYSNYKTEENYKAETRRRYTELKADTRFGEIVIPAGSLINRGDPARFTHLPYSDPLLELETIRFQKATPVAGVLAHALSVEGASLTIELAKKYQLETSEGSELCPAGYILQFPFPERQISDEQRIEPPYTWFRPSDWQADACFESVTGVMVMHVNQDGIYFPEAGKPYTPQQQCHLC